MYGYWRFALSLVVLSVNLSSAQTPVVSDPQALSLAQKSVAALLGSASITDVDLQGNVISIVGADSESGTGTFQAKGPDESRVDLNLGKEVRSDVRSTGNGFPTGAWKRDVATAQKYATHNCWTDAAWFFPALSTLAQTANPIFVFSYLGQQKRAAIAVEHLRVYQQGLGPVPQLSTMDFYLDAVSLLPLTIAYQQHPDNDLLTNIPVEINFANYKAVEGIQVPFHFQRSYNGGVDLDVTVTSAAVNTGISESTFSLQ